jgi:hypothetical protein
MKLGESIQTYNPSMAVKREFGTFQVKTPGGEELFITCRPGEVLSVEWGDTGNNRLPYVVTKISEPLTLTTTEHVAPIRATG